MLVDAYGRPAPNAIAHAVSAGIDRAQEAAVEMMRQDLFRSIEASKSTASPRVVNEFGDRLERRDVGLPTVKFSGGKSISVPIHWREER